MRKYKNAVPSYLVLFVLCWLIYYASYLGRMNYSSAMVVLLSSGALSATRAGLISSMYFFSYAVGQVLNGLLGDKLSVKYMPVCGIVLAAVCNIIMGFSIDSLLICCTINGFAQSMIWPPMVKNIATYMPDRVKIKAFTYLSTTIPCGTISSYLLSAMLLKYASVQAVFFVPAGVMLLCAAAYLCCFPKEILAQTQLSLIRGQESKSIRSVLLTPVILVAIIPVFVQGIMKDGFTTWVPSFINEMFQADAVTSVLLTIVLPFVNLIGAYGVCYLQKKNNNELLMAGFFFFIAFVAMLLLRLFASTSLVLALILLSVGSTCILAINTVFVSYLPIHFAKYNRSAFVSGLLNAIAYLGAAVSTFGIGIVVDGFGWHKAILCFVLLTALSAVICISCAKKNKL